MSAVVLSMSMSLDGYVAGPHQRTLDNGLGDGGERLHEWIFAGAGVPDELKGTTAHLRGANRQVNEELMSTGAVVTGRGTFEAAHAWGGDHHDAYVADIGSAVERAKAAADGRNVMMHGVTAARLALEAGVLDELEISLVPVLLGGGIRLFDGIPPEQIELERVRTLEGDDGMVHLHCRVVRAAN